MLATISPAGLEELFVACGVPVTGTQPPADEVLPAPDEIVRLFAGYGCDIVGPPPALSVREEYPATKAPDSEFSRHLPGGGKSV